MKSRRALITAMVFALIWSSAMSASGSPYSVTVRTNEDVYVAGDYVEISGFVTDQGNMSISTFVEIAVLAPENATLSVDTAHSDSRGYFFMLLTLPPNASLGTYLVTATAEGPPSNTTFEVVPYSITCLVNISSAYPETPILVYGDAHPSRRAEVKLEFSRDDRDWQTIANIHTNSSGHYGYDWAAPGVGGNYSIRARLGGAKSPTAHLRVIVKEPTMISFSLSSYVTQVGKSVDLVGMLNSTCRNATISINYVGPEGTSVNHTVQADPVGIFVDAFQPDKEGIWAISASWPGDALNQRASTMEVQLTVGPPPPTVLFLSVIVVEDVVVLAFLVRWVSGKRRRGRR